MHAGGESIGEMGKGTRELSNIRMGSTSLPVKLALRENFDAQRIVYHSGTK